MSQHPSLKVDSVGIKHRNVLKRYEKVKKLISMGKWNDESSSAFKLPKIKSLKVKVKSGGGKKEDAEAKAGEGEAAAGAAAPAKPAK